MSVSESLFDFPEPPGDSHIATSSKLVETSEDLEVKRKAWTWNKRELLEFVNQYAKEAEYGSLSTPSGEQDAIAADAGKANFPITLVRELGNLLRRINDTENSEKKSDLKRRFDCTLRNYAEKIGLGQVFS